MPKRMLCGAAMLAAALAGSPVAWAADQAGADALQADLDTFLAELERTMPVRFEPANPVRVSVKEDAYLVEIAPMVAVLEGVEGPLAELHLGRTALNLVPDPADPDVTAFEVLSMPPIELWAAGRLVAEMGYDEVVLSGRWSDAIDQVIDYRSRIEGLRASIDMLGLVMQPVGEPGYFETTIALMESEGALAREPQDLWAVRSSMRLQELVGTLTPVRPGAAPFPVQRFGTLSVTTTLTGYPAGEWRDVVVEWLPVLITAAAENRRLERDELIELVTDLPTPFNDLTTEATATDAERQGVLIAEQTQRLEIRGAALDVLDMTSHDEGSGVSYQPSAESNPDVDALLTALLPSRYVADTALHNIPLGHALGEIVDTIDAWIDDPDAGAEIFFRSFASRARTLATDGSMTLALAWDPSGGDAGAAFDLTVDMAAGQETVVGIAGTIDAAFTGMGVLGERLQQAGPREAAAGWALLQAFGEFEESADGSVTRYRLEIEPDGAITFNGQDFGPVVRAVEGFFSGLTNAFQHDDFPPDPDGGPVPAPPAPQP